MTSSTIAIDRAALQESFRQWEAEQTELDAQLAESVAALDAYQSHLDAWHQELIRERSELQELRAALEHDQASAGVDQQQVDQLSNELGEARKKLASLTTSLLARTEELRDLDRGRAEVQTELTLARARERELAAELAAQQQSWEAERQQWEKERHRQRELAESPATVAGQQANQGELPPSGPPKRAPSAASPVLGSVMEQFGKLRQQRSLGRPGQSKPG